MSCQNLLEYICDEVNATYRAQIGDIGTFATCRPLFHTGEFQENVYLYDNVGTRIARQLPNHGIVSMYCYTLSKDANIDLLRELQNTGKWIKIDGIAECVPIRHAIYKMIGHKHCPNITNKNIDEIKLIFEVFREWRHFTLQQP